MSPQEGNKRGTTVAEESTDDRQYQALLQGGGDAASDHLLHHTRSTSNHSPAPSTKKQNQHHGGHRSPKLIFFRIGPLRFGIHGVAGILGTVFVSYALFLSHFGHQISFWLSGAVVISTLTSAIGSYNLLYQVPTTSHISSWIFPPHREAFKRTISIIGYLNLRLIHHWQWWDVSLLGGGRESIIFPLLLFIYTNHHFFPTHADYSNGNTWVFVLPMFLGFNADAIRQFPTLNLNNITGGRNGYLPLLNGSSKTCEGQSLISEFVNNLNWDAVHNWNQYRVNETYLLLTLLCALQIAFMFTVAFRGRMSIKSCYWIAAIEVGLLCIRLFYV
jgi:hypothetical protein